VWFGLRGELQDNDLKYLFLAATLAR
jgi:hypothetical protein